MLSGPTRYGWGVDAPSSNKISKLAVILAISSLFLGVFTGPFALFAALRARKSGESLARVALWVATAANIFVFGRLIAFMVGLATLD